MIDVEQAARQFLTDIIEHLPLMIFVKGADELRFRLINRAGEELLGFPREELLGKNDYDFFPKEQADFFTSKDRQVLERGEVADIPQESIDTKYGPRLLHTIKVPIRDNQGHPRFLLGISEDITERARMQQALTRTRERNRQILETAHEAFVGMDAGGVIIDWNQAAEEIFGWPREEAIGRSLADTIIPQSYRRAHQLGLKHFLQTGEGPLLNKRTEVTALHRDGHEFPAEMTISPLAVDDTYIFHAFIHDISERKAREQQLEKSQREASKARLAAEKANRAKSEFLANMSHEIRTPMNGISGMIELLLDTSISAHQREYLELAQRSAEVLNELLSDILDLSKIEAGKIELIPTPFRLRDSLADTLQSLALRAANKGLELTFYIPSEVPDALLGDLGRLRQVIVNLVGNSIKFTEQGEVKLRVSLDPAEEHQVCLHFQICDTGPGIPPEAQEQIFEAFGQAEQALSRKHGGTGLGLTISKHLIELMGGRIWVESEVGQGSTFHFTSCFEFQAEKEPSPLREYQTLDNMPALIVDDNETNRRMLHDMMANWGMKPETAEGYEEALSQLQATAQQGQSYPIVLIDAVMPDGDGFSLAQHIRTMPSFADSVLLVLSSAGEASIKGRKTDAPIDGYITKPVKQSTLLNTIIRALGIEPEEEITQQDRKVPTQKRQLQILLAEDNPVNQMTIIRLLERRGHHVELAHNGREALELLQKQPFHLVLMDVRMPEMDGFEATQLIREKEKQTNAHIPIIALTAHAMRGDRERCLEAGMDEYLPKPIRSKDLFETIQRIARDELVSLQQKQTEEHAKASIDRKGALEFVDDSEELLQELVEMFLEHYPIWIDGIQQAIAEKDGAELRRLAHMLKGSVRVFCAEKAANVALSLERMGEKREFTQATETLRKLEMELEQIIPELRTWSD